MIDENFREMDSADSLYDSFSDSTTSCSEVDSDPKNDFIGKTVSRTTQQQRGRPRTGGLQIRGRVRVRGGSFRGRCLRTREGHGKRVASEVLDEQKQPQASDGGNAGVALNDSDDNWSEEPHAIKHFPFTETPDMTADVPADADPMLFFFNLIFTGILREFGKEHK